MKVILFVPIGNRLAMDDGLSFFHPIIKQWFIDRFGVPSEVQRLAWPAIVQNKHLLITAPTGSGKTLTAFLWALDRLLCGAWESGCTRILYVSPLKALNNDIQRNLIVPLTELQIRFQEVGVSVPKISVMTRSGDTDSSERTRMLRNPPEILITTPESLNLLIGSMQGRSILADIQTVILDEIHSIAGNKRGAHLITAIDRLVLLSGEFQRIALSATVRPLQRIAEWVGGRQVCEQGTEFSYSPRKVDIIDCRQSKEIRLQVRFIDPSREERTNRYGGDPTYWVPLAMELKEAIHRNRSTLIFTNNRRTCEQIGFLLNQNESKRIAYAHHGSLSRETRSVVERRLKQGELAAIVATSSLELGIDIGALDEVLMIQTPPGIASALQRVGRAGHGVGQISNGILFSLHGRDLLDAAVVARSVMEREIEETLPVENPLDLLAQIITSMCGVEEWDIDRLYGYLKGSAPFFDLSRAHYDRILAMLGGSYSSQRLRHLRPLISIDRIDNTLRAREGALLKVHTGGGTIPDRGYFALRHRDTRSKIGELDEEFVWERRVGDTFMLGTQVWKIHRITHNDVLVLPTDEPARIAPFWRNEQVNRDFYCAEKIALFLEEADRNPKRKSFRKSLIEEYALQENAADALVDFLQRQKDFTSCHLPHRHHLVVEYTHIPGGQADWRQVILHTPWGGRVNQPLAIILAAVWEERGGGRAETVANNEGVLMSVTDEISLAGLLLSIQPGDVEKWLRKKLESSGFFGARFRENASRALLLPKGSFGRRTPLWLHRLRSKELLEAIGRFDDFPILFETWRTCLRDEFDLDSLHNLLAELQTGEIRISEIHTSAPSPFADSLVWIQTNSLVYIGDAAFSDSSSALSQDLIQEVAGNAGLRPEIPSDLIEKFEQRLQRRISGYAPDSEQDLLDWVKERLLIPKKEWDSLCEVIRSHPDCILGEIFQALANKVVFLYLPHCMEPAVIAVENIPRLKAAFEFKKNDVVYSLLACQESSQRFSLDDLHFPKHSTLRENEESRADWLGQWLAFYGPVSFEFVQSILGIEDALIREAAEELLEENRLLVGRLRRESAADELCDRENFERLLRMMRRQAAPRLTPLPVDCLPLFLAYHQGLTRRGESMEELQNALEPLLGFAASAELWERELIPARMKRYQPDWMDDLTRDTDLIWYGCAKQIVTLCFRDQIDLLFDPESSKDSACEPFSLFPDRHGKYDFSHLLEISELSSSQLTESLWKAAWKGLASNDAFGVLRQGIANHFKPWVIPPEEPRGRRAGFGRWRTSRPFAGYWFALDPPIPAEDALEALERQKNSVRLLLDRYGILFRELLVRELPALRWGSLFKTPRQKV